MSTRDQLLEGKLHTIAERLALEEGSIADAVAELRDIASGRTDLLAEAAGIIAGAWSTRPATSYGTEPIAAGLLILAGADRDALASWYDEGRDRASRPLHNYGGTYSPADHDR